MYEWKQQFPAYIWMRGKRYQEQGQVKLKQRTPQLCSAWVSGSSSYEVEIHLSAGKPTAMSCTCPYAAGGTPCKHMAAVLLEMEARDKAAQRAAQPSPAELAASIPETALRALVTQLMEQDPRLYCRILVEYAASEEHFPLELLEEELELLCQEHEGRYGGIDDAHAYDFACAMADFMTERIPTFAGGDPLSAYRLGWETVVRYCSYDVDDSSGGSSLIERAIQQLCERLLQACATDIKVEMYRETVAQYAAPNAHWITAELARMLLLSPIWGDALGAEIRQFLDREIDRLASDPAANAYYLEQTVARRLDATPEPGEQLSFLQSYLYLPAVRIRMAQRLLLEEDWDRAISLLAEGKEQEAKLGHLGVERRFSHLLLDAYDRAGQTEQLCRELEFYIFRYRQDDLEALLGYKALVSPSQWAALRSRYLSGSRPSQAGQLLRHEQMWGELLAYVQQADSITVADAYAEDLLPHYPAQLIDLYRAYLVSQAEPVSDRKHYAHLMVYLQKLNHYPGGSDAAAQLARDWRVRYPRRPAMLDELKKAGF